MKRRSFLALTLAAAAPVARGAADHTHRAPKPPRSTLATNVALDRAGRLWRVRRGEQGVMVDVSDDRGRTFGSAALASYEPAAADGELAPEIAVDQDDAICVAYTLARAHDPIIGHVRFTRSIDGGRSFTPPVTVNDNLEEITHRFQRMLIDGRGRAQLIWIDKRDREASRRAGQPYRGAAVYGAVAAQGRFEANVKLADHSCECCSLALALDPDGVPVAMWRHVFDGGVRDHALVRLDGSVPRRATFENWRIDACPHHGPALAIGAGGRRHLAWFTAAGDEPRVLYQAQDAQGNALAAPRRAGTEHAGYPSLLAAGEHVVLAWKEFNGRATRVFAERSRDGGRTWSPARALSTSEGPSDRPRLVAHDGEIFLSWTARDEGYRLIPAEPAS